MSWLDGLWQAVGAAAMAALAVFGGGDDRPDFNGYVEGEYVRVALPVAGTLERLAVARGDRVVLGQALFVLDRTAELAARDEALARVAQSASQLEDLRKGKRQPELEIIAHQQAQAEASLRLSESELARQERLFKAKVSAEAKLDDARAAYQRDQARVAELKAQMTTARMTARADEIAAAESAVSMTQAALREAEWRLSRRSASAPAAGLVNDTYYREGEMVPAGAAVVSLLPPENVKVRFYVPEAKLSRLRIGQEVSIGCDGCPRDLVATIRYISPQAEYTPPVIYSQESRDKLVFLVEARPPPAAGLHPGQPVEIRLVP